MFFIIKLIFIILDLKFYRLAVKKIKMKGKIKISVRWEIG
jgi:hypothetical protein